MQRDLVSMLHQKSRLAALGLAVSKINHDLRNLLASAQLISDQLATVPDPRVQRFAPKLCARSSARSPSASRRLSYGRAQEAAPDRRRVALDPVIEEVREVARACRRTSITWVALDRARPDVDADPDQLFRILINLARNAVQALEARAPTSRRVCQIRIAGKREGIVTIIEVSTPVPACRKAREHICSRRSRLRPPRRHRPGLTIAAELVRAHGGEIRLVDATIGATFRIEIPDRPVELHAPRTERASA